jgi:hypothetical protein
VAGVVALGVVMLVVHVPKDDAGFEARIKDVSSSILPLLASWVGTILAFYFSKENLLAATDSVTALSKTLAGVEKLKSFPVRSKMRPLGAIIHEQIATGSEDTLPLAALLQKYATVERIIVLDMGNVVQLLIYRSMIERFLSQVATNMVTVTSGHTIDKLTLKDLLVASPDAQLFKTSFGFVSVEATLADAKQVMDKIPKCNDVFVTATGKATEPLVGWITDNVISENATV